MISSLPLTAGPLKTLMVALALVFAPYLLFLPPWLMGVALGLIGWRWLVVQRSWKLMPPLGMALVLVVAVAGVWGQFGTLMGRDGGTAILLVLMGMKLNESKNVRDALLLVLMGFFTLLSCYFFQQDVLITGYTLVIGVLLFGVAAHLRSHAFTLQQNLKRMAPLLWRALPLALVLFVVFPRSEGPLWAVPAQQNGKSGLADEISPGSISNVVRDSSVAFRVEFLDPPPAPEQLYWRGPVFEFFDGQDWKQQRLWGGSYQFPNTIPRGRTIRYRTTMEPHGKNWVLALDAFVGGSNRVQVTTNLQAVSRRPITLRQRFDLQSMPEAWMGRDEDPVRLQAELQLPAEGNPRTRTLAHSWTALDPEARMEAALDFFRNGGFKYTLTPPELSGPNMLDDLLFGTRQGFCEHFAGAFAFLMRAAGVPARVVGGYLGGHPNQNGGYYIVRQTDAHAWVEVWLEGKGWIRVDPTAAVAPTRLTQGLASSLQNADFLPAVARGENSWLTQLQLRLDSLQFLWDQWIIGYNLTQQQALVNLLGTLGTALVLVVLVAVAVFFLVYKRKPSVQHADDLQRVFERFVRRLSRPPEPAEPVGTYAVQMAAAHPEAADTILSIAELYQELRYGAAPSPEQRRAFQRQVQQFRLKP
ncbi:transglutaminase TgpA family protein [Deinococcus roseus]|uniref:Transglutaminase-like domain-containing protein n=1 Tax=Deinococcus roseus TaxID=392414 RepID=A0ABQ2CWS1_9DEIO|nr:DUF3488 and transglutaminase-like domain-containing protein [Deinococcus roseus]GGJ28345.1 hypothetical protein GCM10008938_13030 [Deinococcus roseus]